MPALSPSSLLTRFQQAILDIIPAAYRAGGVAPELLIAQDGALSIDYAPFDHIEPRAQIAIVGLTPGRQQAANAIEATAAALRAGASLDVALERAKRSASFSGPMRANLLAMLDAMDIPALYGHDGAARFFEDAAPVHYTSMLRYPVYVQGQNYSGAPHPLRHPMLRSMVDRYLADEVVRLPDAMWIPLGDHAAAALLHLAERGQLDRRRILAGLPHPSGANAERIAYFLGRKPRERLSNRTNADRLDATRDALRQQIAALRNG